jgi:voltage-gated potassium channel
VLTLLAASVAERELKPTEIGGSPRHLRVGRDGHLLRTGAPEADAVQATDRPLDKRRVGR